MSSMSEDADLDGLHLDPRDREYIAGLDGEEREIVVSTIARYQRQSGLRAGESIPALELYRLDDGEHVRLVELAAGRPLVLVFGSFT
jgi:hypothetical protein